MYKNSRNSLFNSHFQMYRCITKLFSDWFQTFVQFSKKKNWVAILSTCLETTTHHSEHLLNNQIKPNQNDHSSNSTPICALKQIEFDWISLGPSLVFFSFNFLSVFFGTLFSYSTLLSAIKRQRIRLIRLMYMCLYDTFEVMLLDYFLFLFLFSCLFSIWFVHTFYMEVFVYLIHIFWHVSSKFIHPFHIQVSKLLVNISSGIVIPVTLFYSIISR